MADIIDAHVHVWTADQHRYPRAAGALDYPPAEFTPEHFFAHAHPNGVEKAVLVQMSFYGADHSYLLEALRDYPGQFSGVGLIDLTSDRLSQEMDRLSELGIRAFRIVPDGTRDWDGAALKMAWRHAAERGYTICPLIDPEALDAVGAVCEEFADTTVVIDHLARIGLASDIRDEQVRALCGLARHSQVYVKVSAFYALGSKRPPYDDLAPLIRRVYDAFGGQRLMWGSDSPFQVENGHSYRESLTLVRDGLPFLSGTDRNSLLGGTAARVF
jgi:predicted TIM-barrel fold metal-dependent hydrolase